MAITVVTNYTDTAIEGQTAGNLGSVPLINWAVDFTRKESKPNEATLLNMSSPLGKAETVRFAYQRVNNIYTGTGIDPAWYAQSRAGFSVLVQLNDILTITDTDLNTRVDIPLSAHLVLRGALHSALAASHLASHVDRLVGMMNDTLTTPNYTKIANRLFALTKGAVLPKPLV